MTRASEMPQVEASFNARAAHASEVKIGLVPNQPTWPRRNINSFMYTEHRRLKQRPDRLRAAHAAEPTWQMDSFSKRGRS
jgi:hypothetical protein